MGESGERIAQSFECVRLSFWYDAPLLSPYQETAQRGAHAGATRGEPGAQPAAARHGGRQQERQAVPDREGPTPSREARGRDLGMALCCALDPCRVRWIP